VKMELIDAAFPLLQGLTTPNVPPPNSC
jgi:hypothetical protein